jgi:DNA-binding NarL/FixJ family response regulator
MMTVKIALTEDNAINRNTFLQKIKGQPHLQLVFIAHNGNQCLDQLSGLPHLALPQVIFMDIEMPELDGIETIRIAKSLYPHIHFIILSVFDDDEKIFEAVKAGASGYLLKHESMSALEEAIVQVLEYGGAPMSPAVARKTLQLLSRGFTATEQPAGSNLPATLTEREIEVLNHMVNGWDAKRISSELNVSVLTIRKHIANIYDKLHINSKAQAISLAHRQKWFR